MTSGRLWWYPEAVLQPIPANAAPHDVQHPASPGEGSYVTLVADYKSFSDAGRGPLSLMRTEDAYGVVLMESGNRFRVCAESSSSSRTCSPTVEDDNMVMSCMVGVTNTAGMNYAPHSLGVQQQVLQDSGMSSSWRYIVMPLYNISYTLLLPVWLFAKLPSISNLPSTQPTCCMRLAYHCCLPWCSVAPA